MCEYDIGSLFSEFLQYLSKAAIGRGFRGILVPHLSDLDGAVGNRYSVVHYLSKTFGDSPSIQIPAEQVEFNEDYASSPKSLGRCKLIARLD